MRVAIRVDSSPTIGSGHVVRCVTLAEKLRERGADCLFVCREFEGHFAKRILDSNFEIRLLSHERMSTEGDRNLQDIPDYSKWLGASHQADVAETKLAIGESAFDWLIVDHYGIDHRWEAAMHTHCERLMVIDDLANRTHDCDLLLDQNLVDGYRTRYERLVPNGCAVLTGPQFALLQSQYSDLHLRIPTRSGPVRRILAYFGGADSKKLTGMTVDAFLELDRDDIQLDVVLSHSNFRNPGIYAKTSRSSNIFLHESLPSLSNLMAMADLCIGASGTTTWERCCLGLPSIVVTLAANQVPLATELSQLGAIEWLGNHDTITVADLREAIKRNLENPEIIAQRSLISYGLVDGNGVSRVANCLTLSSKTELTLRRVNLTDESLILSLANEPSVRRNSFNSTEIDTDTHRTWFHKKLRNIDGCHFYVVCTREGFPIGQVRFEKNMDEWETHYSLSPCARGRGLGRKTMEIALNEFRKIHPGVTILGRVKRENIPSCRVFESLGFTPECTPGGILIFRSQ